MGRKKRRPIFGKCVVPGQFQGGDDIPKVEKKLGPL